MLTSSHHAIASARRIGRPLVGRCLNDRYSLTSVIAEGSSSVVYAAMDSRTGGEVVIKAAHDGPRAAEAMRRERLAARVVHPYVCAVRDWGEVDGTPCTVLERILGEPLRSTLDRGPIAVPRALEIAVAVATALDGVHRSGLVHRDVTPSNVLLVATAGRRPVVKLIDFGLVQERTETAPPGAPVGTPAYMSPEQTLGRAVGVATDIFSTGIVLFEMLMGYHPFATVEDESALFERIRTERLPTVLARRGIPPLVEEVIEQATQKNPDDRYPSAAAMALELEVCLADLRRRGRY